MKHCHLSIMCNELPFLKQKLPFLYKNFDYIIFVDYNISTKTNSNDGSIEYIENFPDDKNKIKLIKDINIDEIQKYRGASIVEKRKMFAIGSKYIPDDIDILWATDLDEFFDIKLIKHIEFLYLKDTELQSVDIPHIIFVYNQYNKFNSDYFYICPRITRHKKGFLYGHCDFASYGKTINLKEYYLYHFAYVGFNRCLFKLKYIYKDKDWRKWCIKYLSTLKSNKKYINIDHPNKTLTFKAIPFIDEIPKYINCDVLCKELNKL